MLERQLSRAYIFQILRYAPEKCGHKLRNSVLIPYFHSICRQFAPDSFKEHIFSYSCCFILYSRVSFPLHLTSQVSYTTNSCIWNFLFYTKRRFIGRVSTSNLLTYIRQPFLGTIQLALRRGLAVQRTSYLQPHRTSPL